MRERFLQMFERFKIRDFAIVFLGRGAGGVLNILFMLLAARLLQSELFGLFALSITVMHIGSQFAGQGMDTVLVRLYVLHSRDGSRQEASVLRSCLWVRVLLTVATVAIGGLLAEIYVRMTGRLELRLPLLFGFVGCALMSAWQYALSVLQAREEYGRHSALSLATNFLKIALLGALVLANRTDLPDLLNANLAALGLGVAVSALAMPRRYFEAGMPLPDGARHVFRYGRWVILSGLASILYNRLDVLVLSAARSATEVGFYSATASLITGFDLLITALFVVFLPSASRIHDYADTIEYLKFSTAIASAALILPLLCFFFAQPLLLLTLGEGFRESVDLFRIMLPGFMIYLFTFPWALIIYSYNQPHLLFATDVVVLAFAAVASLVFIPTHGMIAAAWINLCMRLLNSALIVFLVIRESRRLRDRGDVIVPATGDLSIS